ncbi:DinB family protein [Ornithinibacillus xuwenensis]|uniref:DinB family protein n=1 Tax=Ornithinibacillus xuwenensis TaxID=3144668 RepID=A0ABU9XJW3_9BACI
MEVKNKARKDLIIEIEGISDKEINRRIATDTWSIGQVLEHLYYIEKAFIKMITRQLESGEDVFAKEQPIQLTVDRSYKVPSPEFAIPSPEDKKLDTLIKQLNSSHQILADLIHQTEPEQLISRGIPHPIFGNLSLKQTIDFLGYHEMRHIEQIKEIKHALGVTK